MNVNMSKGERFSTWPDKHQGSDPTFMCTTHNGAFTTQNKIINKFL